MDRLYFFLGSAGTKVL